MLYPVFKYDERNGSKSYLANFRDFYYNLVITKQTGFELTLAMGKPHGAPSGEQIPKEKIIATVELCLERLKYLEKSIINNEKQFQFFRIQERLDQNYCAVSDYLNQAFICTSTHVAHEIYKSLRKVETNSEQLTSERRKRSTKVIDEIKRWECIEGWSGTHHLLKALKTDLLRLSSIREYKAMRERDRMQLSKICSQHKIHFKAINDNGRAGVQISGHTFFNHNAAQHYIYAIVEEKIQYHHPSYNLHLDRSL